MKRIEKMVIVLILSVHILDAVAGEVPKWNHLSVTFPKFSDVPMLEHDAIKSGWTLISDDCKDSSSPFLGKRYMLNNLHSTILIFDASGQVAGFQMSYKTLLKKGHYHKYSDMFQRVKEKDGEYFYLTAYFIKPDAVCTKTAVRPDGVFGDKLTFMTGRNKYMEVPSLKEDLKKTKWVLGKCFPGMGLHYWYDISKDMDCDDMFPGFLLYDKPGYLVGWGFEILVDVPGARVEHPPTWIAGAVYKRSTQPTCLSTVEHRSTQHVYFTKGGILSRLCMFG